MAMKTTESATFDWASYASSKKAQLSAAAISRVVLDDDSSDNNYRPSSKPCSDFGSNACVLNSNGDVPSEPWPTDALSKRRIRSHGELNFLPSGEKNSGPSLGGMRNRMSAKKKEYQRSMSSDNVTLLSHSEHKPSTKKRFKKLANRSRSERDVPQEDQLEVKSILKRTSSYTKIPGLSNEEENTPVVNLKVSLRRNTKRNGRRAASSSPNLRRCLTDPAPTSTMLIDNLQQKEDSNVKSILKRTSSYTTIPGLSNEEENKPVVDHGVSLRMNTKRNGRRAGSSNPGFCRSSTDPAPTSTTPLGDFQQKNDSPVLDGNGRRRRRRTKDTQLPVYRRVLMDPEAGRSQQNPLEVTTTSNRSPLARQVSFSSVATAARWTHQGSASTDNLNALVMPSRPSRRGSNSKDETASPKAPRSLKSLQDLRTAFGTGDASASAHSSNQGNASWKVGGAATTANSSKQPAPAMKRCMSAADAFALRKLVNNVSIRKPARRTSIELDTSSSSVEVTPTATTAVTPTGMKATVTKKGLPVAVADTAALRKLVNNAALRKPIRKTSIEMTSSSSSRLSPKMVPSKKPVNIFQSKVNDFLMDASKVA